MELSTLRKALDWVYEYQSNFAENSFEPKLTTESYVSNGHFLALDVNQTDEDMLLRPKARGDKVTLRLPIKAIQPWSKELSVAIVSWRWDGDVANKDPAYKSRNLCAAIKYAKSASIQYLLVDIISINQQAPSGVLMDTLQDFTTYYESLPVICAYQMAGQSIENNVRRPWIFSELQRIQLNRRRITHVRHTFGQDPPSGQIFQTIWETRVQSIVLGLLYGTVQMHYPRDLQYILPPELTTLVFRAFYKLRGSDFYLAALLLVKAYELPMTDWYDVLPPDDGWIADLEVFHLRKGTDGCCEIVLISAVELTVGYWYFSKTATEGSRPYSKIYTRSDTIRKIANFTGSAEYPEPLQTVHVAKSMPDIHEIGLDLSTGMVIDSRAVHVQTATHVDQDGLAKALYPPDDRTAPAAVSEPWDWELRMNDRILLEREWERNTFLSSLVIDSKRPGNR